MPVRTRSQKFAMAAYDRIALRTQNGQQKVKAEYVTFAKKFPALVHTCGLAQAVVFAIAKDKDHELYVDDLASVLHGVGHAEITSARSVDEAVRKSEVSVYMRLSRDAIEAASWLKRYVEATGESD